MFGGVCAQYNTALTQIRLTREGVVMCEYANSVAHLALASAPPHSPLELTVGDGRRDQGLSVLPSAAGGLRVWRDTLRQLQQTDPQALAALLGDSRTSEEGDNKGTGSERREINRACGRVCGGVY